LISTITREPVGKWAIAIATGKCSKAICLARQSTDDRKSAAQGTGRVFHRLLADPLDVALQHSGSVFGVTLAEEG
jgi:hypothetical protein